MSRRIGRINYMQEMAETEAFANVLCKVPLVPLKLEFDGPMRYFELTAYSPLFDEVEEGEFIPEYAVQMMQGINPETNKPDPPIFEKLVRLGNPDDGVPMPWEEPGA